MLYFSKIRVRQVRLLGNRVLRVILRQTTDALKRPGDKRCSEQIICTLQQTLGRAALMGDTVLE